jgi:hypothetical protein
MIGGLIKFLSKGISKGLAKLGKIIINGSKNRVNIFAKLSNRFGKALRSIEKSRIDKLRWAKKNPWMAMGSKLMRKLTIATMIGGTMFALGRIFKGKGNPNSVLTPNDAAREPAFDIPPMAGVQQGSISPDQLNSLVKAMSAGNKNQRVTQIQQAIEAAKADQMAYSKLLAKLPHFGNEGVPDKLQKIYAKGKDSGSKLDAIIELLNRQNDISNAHRITSVKIGNMKRAEDEAKADRATQLYQKLSVLHAQSMSANNDAVEAISRTSKMQTGMVMRQQAQQHKQVMAQAKQSSIFKWLLFGGILAGIGKLLGGFSGVADLLKSGFGAVWDGLGSVRDAIFGTSKSMAESLSEKSDDKLSDKDLDNDSKQLSDEQKALATSVVAGTTLEDTYKNNNLGNQGYKAWDDHDKARARAKADAKDIKDANEKSAKQVEAQKDAKLNERAKLEEKVNSSKGKAKKAARQDLKKFDRANPEIAKEAKSSAKTNKLIEQYNRLKNEAQKAKGTGGEKAAQSKLEKFISKNPGIETKADVASGKVKINESTGSKKKVLKEIVNDGLKKNKFGKLASVTGDIIGKISGPALAAFSASEAYDAWKSGDNTKATLSALQVPLMLGGPISLGLGTLISLASMQRDQWRNEDMHKWQDRIAKMLSNPNSAFYDTDQWKDRANPFELINDRFGGIKTLPIMTDDQKYRRARAIFAVGSVLDEFKSGYDIAKLNKLGSHGFVTPDYMNEVLKDIGISSYDNPGKDSIETPLLFTKGKGFKKGQDEEKEDMKKKLTSGFFSKLWQYTKGGSKDLVKNLLGGGWDALKGIGNLVGDAFGGMWDNITRNENAKDRDIWGDLKQIGGGLISSVLGPLNFFKKSGRKNIDEVSDKIAKDDNVKTKIVDNLFKYASGTAPQYADGTLRGSTDQALEILQGKTPSDAHPGGTAIVGDPLHEGEPDKPEIVMEPGSKTAKLVDHEQAGVYKKGTTVIPVVEESDGTPLTSKTAKKYKKNAKIEIKPHDNKAIIRHAEGTGELEDITDDENPVEDEELAKSPVRQYAVGTLNDSDTRKMAVMSYLVNKGGLTPVQAAGIVGNMMQESRLTPNIQEKGGGGYGLAQWTGPRRNNLIKFLSSYSGEYGSATTGKSSLGQQLDFLMSELNGAERVNWGSVSTPADSARLFLTKFERANWAKANGQFRQSQANAAYNLWNANKNMHDLGLYKSELLKQDGSATPDGDSSAPVESNQNEESKDKPDTSSKNWVRTITGAGNMADFVKAAIGTGNLEALNFYKDGTLKNNLTPEEELRKILTRSNSGTFDSSSRGKNVRLNKEDYKGLCTSGPQTFYNEAGINLAGKWWNTGNPHSATGSNLSEAGFAPVWSGSRSESVTVEDLKSTLSGKNKKLQPGDIITIFGRYSNGGASSHAMMWNGKEIVSDTYQGNKIWVYPKDRLGSNSTIVWRYKDFQHPGFVPEQLAATCGTADTGVEVVGSEDKVGDSGNFNESDWSRTIKDAGSLNAFIKGGDFSSSISNSVGTALNDAIYKLGTSAGAPAFKMQTAKPIKDDGGGIAEPEASPMSSVEISPSFNPTAAVTASAPAPVISPPVNISKGGSNITIKYDGGTSYGGSSTTNIVQHNSGEDPITKSAR